MKTHTTELAELDKALLELFPGDTPWDLAAREQLRSQAMYQTAWPAHAIAAAAFVRAHLDNQLPGTERLRARMGKDRADALLDNVGKNIICLATDAESHESLANKMGTFRALAPSSKRMG